MTETITAVYEHGVLRPLTPLALPEHTQVQIQIIHAAQNGESERGRVRHALIEAGIIHPQVSAQPPAQISEVQLAEAARSLGEAGPLSELIIAQRAER